MKKNAMTLICILASFALVAACSPKAKKAESDKPNTTASAMGAPSGTAPSGGLPTTPAPAMAPSAPPAAPSTGGSMSAPPAMGTPPAALPNTRTVMVQDPKGKALTLLMRECTKQGSYKKLSTQLNMHKEILCYNPNTGKTHRMCFKGQPVTKPVTPDVVGWTQVRTFPQITSLLHTETVVGGDKVVTSDLVCHLVPMSMVGKAPRQRTYRRSRGMRSWAPAPRARTRRRTTVASGGPTAYDLEQDRRIKANTVRSKRNERRLDENDEWRKARDKWARAIDTAVTSRNK